MGNKYNKNARTVSISVEDIIKVLSENESILWQVLSNESVSEAIMKITKETKPRKAWYEILLQFLPILWSIASKFLLKSYNFVARKK